MLTTDQEFKFAFLKECAEGGLDMDETAKVAEELAEYLSLVDVEDLKKEAGVGSALGALWNKVVDVGGAAVPLAASAAIAAPPLLGYGLGHLAAKATDVSDEDVDEMKDREVIDEYRRQTEQAKARQAAKANAVKLSPRGRRWA